MESLTIIRNRANGTVSEISTDQWNRIKNAPEWRGVFERVRTIKEPPEVLALKAKKAAQGTKKIS